MLSIRKALLTHSWDEIITAIKGYKSYADQSGKTGSEYVKKPKAFFDEGLYAETFEFKPAIDPRLAEIANRDAERMAKAVAAGERLEPPLKPYHMESAAAFESRVATAATVGKPVLHDGVQMRISNLTDRMRVK